MAFGTLNTILSTAVSITYTCCCAIVLMLHNYIIYVITRNSLIINELHHEKSKNYKDL